MVMKIWVILSVLSLSNFNSVKSQDTIPEMILNYTGSSTIGNFIEDASPVFGQADFKSGLCTCISSTFANYNIGSDH